MYFKTITIHKALFALNKVFSGIYKLDKIVESKSSSYSYLEARPSWMYFRAKRINWLIFQVPKLRWQHFSLSDLTRIFVQLGAYLPSVSILVTDSGCPSSLGNISCWGGKNTMVLYLMLSILWSERARSKLSVAERIREQDNKASKCARARASLSFCWQTQSTKSVYYLHSTHNITQNVHRPDKKFITDNFCMVNRATRTKSWMGLS